MVLGRPGRERDGCQAREPAQRELEERERPSCLLVGRGVSVVVIETVKTVVLYLCFCKESKQWRRVND